MKIILSLLICCVLSIPFCMTELSIDEFFISNFYNAICIVFSVGMGLIVTFSLEGVKNIAYIKQIRSNIRDARNKFIALFIICNILLIFEKLCQDITIYNIEIKKYCSFTTLFFFFYSIFYFITKVLNHSLVSFLFIILLKFKY